MVLPGEFCCHIHPLKERRGERDILSPLDVKRFLYNRYIFFKKSQQQLIPNTFFSVNEIIKHSILSEKLKESCREFICPIEYYSHAILNCFSVVSIATLKTGHPLIVDKNESLIHFTHG